MGFALGRKNNPARLGTSSAKGFITARSFELIFTTIQEQLGQPTKTTFAQLSFKNKKWEFWCFRANKIPSSQV